MMIEPMNDPEFTLDVQTPSAAISEIATGMADLRFCALVGSMDWAGERWPGIPTDGSSTHDQ